MQAETKPGGRFFCIADIALKAPEIAVRIATSQKFFADEDTSDINIDELERAFQLMEFLLGHAFSIYYPLSDENKEKCLFIERARKLYEWIREHNVEPFPLQEIKRGLRFAREPEILYPLLNQLISQGELVLASYPFDRTIYVTWPAKDLNYYGKYSAVIRYWDQIVKCPNNTDSTGPYIDVSDIKARY